MLETSGAQDLFVYIVSSTFALPAALFFLYAALSGILTLINAMRYAWIKSLFVITILFAVFSITYYYFSIEPTLEGVFKSDTNSIIQFYASSSHTLCLALGVATAQWIRVHSFISRALLSIILVSIFFIGSVAWFVVLHSL